MIYLSLLNFQNFSGKKIQMKDTGAFSIHAYEVKIKAKSPISIPYFPGSMLRGAFGVALKRVICLQKNKSCNDCLLSNSCVYRFLFETEVQKPIKGIISAPHPLIIYPLSLGEKMMKRGSTYRFGFTLFGRATSYLPYVVYAITEMGKIGIGRGKGRFELIEVRKRISDKKTKQIFNHKENRLISIDDCLESKKIFKKKWRGERLIIETITPLRLKIRGKLRDNLELRDLLFIIAHRLKILSLLYGNGEIDFFKDIDLDRVLKGINVDAHFKWIDFRRFSRRQNAHLKIGGIMGRMLLTGTISPIYPLLKIGEYVHIGKNTAFGLGRYHLK